MRGPRGRALPPAEPGIQRVPGRRGHRDDASRARYLGRRSATVLPPERPGRGAAAAGDLDALRYDQRMAGASALRGGRSPGPRGPLLAGPPVDEPARRADRRPAPGDQRLLHRLWPHRAVPEPGAGYDDAGAAGALALGGGGGIALVDRRRGAPGVGPPGPLRRRAGAARRCIRTRPAAAGCLSACGFAPTFTRYNVEALDRRGAGCRRPGALLRPLCLQS